MRISEENGADAERDHPDGATVLDPVEASLSELFQLTEDLRQMLGLPNPPQSFGPQPVNEHPVSP